MPDLFEPLTLPNGITLPNRLCKAAMEENLCDKGQIPGQRLYTLYRQWAEGNVGLILTGNVMVSPNALTGPGGVVLENDSHIERFKQWAQSVKTAPAKEGQSHIWMQLSHPGRQVYASMGEEALAPSPISVNIPGFSKLFAQPRALNNDEIENIIARFANAAALAEQAGFDGCQIHAAHGYLISQFLSPLTNQRDDQWGGSLENRARLLFETIKAVRAKVRPEFCVSIKLNSADFQKGGFDSDDAKWVIEKLNDMPIDLVELSGGSYESPAMQGSASKDSTGDREAYFIEFARDIAKVAKMPIMVTGGVRKKQIAIEALQQPSEWQQEQSLEVTLPSLSWKNKTLAALGMMAITKAQLNRLANGKSPKLKLNPVVTIIKDRVKTKWRTQRYKRWRKSSS